MKEKRKVSANLGRTQHRNAELLYKQIKKRIGPTRRCPFYNGSKYSQFSKDEHDKLNPRFPNPRVPVEQYDFALNSKNGKWGLQAYCKVCYKAYRDARIGRARSTWMKPSGKKMTDGEIRRWYVKNVGSTMACSVCHEAKAPSEFSISLSMEKGLHNVCYECTAAQGASVREQAWLADGDWSSWKSAVMKMRKSTKVTCAGWPRAQELGLCKRQDSGKKMHADHRVPLRAGGINDAKNFQALCSVCNTKKSDQLDPRLRPTTIIRLLGKPYQKVVKMGDSTQTTERKLKVALYNRIKKLCESKTYLEALKKKKREVNGQWDVNHAYKKGVAWVKRGGAKTISTT